MAALRLGARNISSKTSRRSIAKTVDCSSLRNDCRLDLH